VVPHAHEHIDHSVEQTHHHHAHAQTSHHVDGHHLLQVEGLSISFTMYESAEPRFFRARRMPVEVISDLHIGVHAGELVAIVGASGSGKTLLADAIMGIFEPNATVRGRIWFNGVEQNAASLAALAGNGISLVPQSVNHLDPLMKVGRQILGHATQGATQGGRSLLCSPKTGRKQTTECFGNTKETVPLVSGNTKETVPLVSHPQPSRAERLAELFKHYDLPPEVADKYPHELSGGMARRVLLCCALMDDPQVIIADEPTPGLDLELARRALDDFREFADSGRGVLLITHDIELALRVADRVAVFAEGTVIEETAVANFASPDTLEHPFTRALWHALPEHDFQVPDDATDAATATAADTTSTPIASDTQSEKNGEPC
jgi:peptide/nickel transport system ATP-binding protein